MANPDPVISVETQFAEGNQASLKHGIRSLRASGEIPEALCTDDLRRREAEIVANLADMGGIEREMERATRVGLLCLELGASWLYKEINKGKGFADIKVLGKLRSYLSGTMRDLEKLAALKKELGKDGNVLDYEQAILRDG